MNKKAKIFILYIIFGIVIICMTSISYSYDTDNISFNNEAVTSYNNNWEYRNENGEWNRIDLPVKLSVNGSNNITIKNVLPSKADAGINFCLCIRTSQQTLSIKVDGKVIYEYGTDSSRFFGKSAGSAWNIVRIPNEYAGKTVEITFTSPYEVNKGILNPIFYGSKAAIMYKLWNDYGLRFIISMLLVIIGICLIMFYFIYRKILKESINILYFGSFVLMISLWFLGESRMLQFIIGNQVIVSELAFWMIQILPIPMIMFIEETYVVKCKILLKISYIALIINFFVLSVLHMTGIRDFYETLIFTEILILLSIVLSIIALIKEMFGQNKKRVRKFMLLFSVVIICAVFEFIDYNFNFQRHTSKIIFEGLIVFILFLLISIIRKTKDMLRERTELKYYEKLAYEDLLVKGKNRTAYYKDIENKIDEIENINDLILIMFDLNNLKIINDKYGHRSGDEALINCFKCIKSSFGELGECYRIGGDEFACLCFSCDLKEVEEAKLRFIKNINEIDKITLYDFDIAFGYGMFDLETDKNFDDFSNRVDKAMYANKLESKT